MRVPIIDPATGASEYGANLAQWDWKPFDTAMDAAKTTYNMVQGNKEEKRKQEEFELEKILFPTKQKLAELSLTKMQSEIAENNARAEALLGQADADSLGTSYVGGNLINERIAMIAGGGDYGYLWSSNAASAPAPKATTASPNTASVPLSINSTAKQYYPQ
jgi:hypothetical protein